jgi:phytanoyl-CoA hydroxylase
MAFDPAIKRFYDDNGYVIVERVFTDAELSPLRERTDEMVRDPSLATKGVRVGRESETQQPKLGEKPPAVDPIRKFEGTVRFDPIFQAFARQPKLHELVRGLIGPRIKIFRDQMLLKPPGGQDKPTHQDQSYFRVKPMDGLVTAWVALDDATTDNGCMRYVPGSHKFGILEMHADPERPVHHVPKTDGLNLAPEVACPVPAGSIIFHHGLTLHRSGVNNTQTWRKALILHFATADAMSEIGPLNKEISLIIDA